MAVLEKKLSINDFSCLRQPVGKKGYLLAKRAGDLVLSALASAVLVIPVGVLAVMTVCKDFGSPFYCQTRVGQDGKPFRIVKLRTMKKGADRLEEMLSPEQLAEYKSEFKLSDDPRLIGWKKPGDGKRCFGAFLRRTSLDELPQIFFNICIRGNMSIVGPRPILQEELRQNYSEAEARVLLSVKPGLTGYWQAYARNDASYRTGLRQKMELSYAKNANLLWDIKIIFATIGAVIRKQGAK